MAHTARDAQAIWWAGVQAVQPATLIPAVVRCFADSMKPELAQAERVVVVGAGKAGGGMASALEQAWQEQFGSLAQLSGWVNIPAADPRELKPAEHTRQIHLHPARPHASNFPTEAGVVGTRAIIERLRSIGPYDLALGLFSGGGSALLPLPRPGLSLADKLEATKQLSHAGASIQELNTVRKHLSGVKGGQLAQHFHGKLMMNWILSDVVGDPLDVIAAGPTVADPTTLADCFAIIDRYELRHKLPVKVLRLLEQPESETPKSLPSTIRNQLIGTNDVARRASAAAARAHGYAVIDLGGQIIGDTATAARDCAAWLIAYAATTQTRPVCVLSGGETTVPLGPNPGLGGRNQEFALHLWLACPPELRNHLTILCAGTDGEDGPTDAAGALITATNEQPWQPSPRALDQHLVLHNVYPFLDREGKLFRTGLTGTNVMDLRVLILR